MDESPLFSFWFLLLCASFSSRRAVLILLITQSSCIHSVDKCFVPSAVLRQVALDRGLREDQIVQHGLPIRSGFWSTTTTSRGPHKKLNLLPDIPNVLVVGGGDGMGGLVAIARALITALAADQHPFDRDDDDTTTTSNSYSQQHVKCQLTIVCGKNSAAKHILEQDLVKWSSSVVPTQILGFVDNMDEWMQASTILVTKAGPGTIAEASICGLPCMMFSYLYVFLLNGTGVGVAVSSFFFLFCFPRRLHRLFHFFRFLLTSLYCFYSIIVFWHTQHRPGQEEGNIPFVEKSGFGKYSNDPRVIAETIKAWLADPVLLQQMQQCALTAARPRATLDIANDLVELLLLQQQTKKEDEVEEEEEKLLGSSTSSSFVGTNQAKELLVK